MIEGVIRETGTPILALKVIGKGGVEVTVEGILDTGFDGFLCLPIPLAVSLGLELIDVTRTELADGTVVEDELVFAGRAEWDGTVIDVDILLTRSGDVLIGTAFLKEYLVHLDYKANIIMIEKTPKGGAALAGAAPQSARGNELRYFITGSAGFIGSNLVDRLLQDGHEVVGYDNFSTGQPEFLVEAQQSPRFHLVQGDTLDLDRLTQAMHGTDFVFHLAANADVRFGTHHPRKDLEQNTIATSNVLEAMRTNGIQRLAFASTGSIYGEPDIFPTPEDAPFPLQTSLYGASKLAAEGLIAAYCEGFGFQGYIFRFVSILGERYTHGHVFDFYQQLRDHPDTLHVLGNGKQRKSYLYVQDCINAMLLAIKKARGKVNVFNLGTDEYCQVDDSIGWICKYLGVSPQRTYAGDERGWVGDSPFIFLDCARIRALGWQPRVSICEGVRRTVRYLEQNPWILERCGSG